MLLLSSVHLLQVLCCCVGLSVQRLLEHLHIKRQTDTELVELRNMIKKKNLHILNSSGSKNAPIRKSKAQRFGYIGKQPQICPKACMKYQYSCQIPKALCLSLVCVGACDPPPPSSSTHTPASSHPHDSHTKRNVRLLSLKSSHYICSLQNVQQFHKICW